MTAIVRFPLKRIFPNVALTKNAGCVSTVVYQVQLSSRQLSRLGRKGHKIVRMA